MIIVGIDASTTSTGISVFVDDKLEDYKRIAQKDKDILFRIESIRNSVDDFLKKYKPNAVYIEDVPLSNAVNRRVAEKLLLLQGTILGVCFENKCRFIQLEPTKWRKLSGVTCKNKREEQKKFAIELVCRRYGLQMEWIDKKYDEVTGFSDICESILIGYAGTIVERNS